MIDGHRVTHRRQLLGRFRRGRDQEPAPAGAALQFEHGPQLAKPRLPRVRASFRPH
jgi:hypothetical protein